MPSTKSRARVMGNLFRLHRRRSRSYHRRWQVRGVEAARPAAHRLRGEEGAGFIGFLIPGESRSDQTPAHANRPVNALTKNASSRRLLDHSNTFIDRRSRPKGKQKATWTCP